MSMGDFNKAKSDGSKDENIIEQHLVEPKLTSEEVKKPPLISRRELMILVMMTSGMTREQAEEGFTKALKTIQENQQKK